MIPRSRGFDASALGLRRHNYQGISEGALAATTEALAQRPQTHTDSGLHLRAGELFVELA